MRFIDTSQLVGHISGAQRVVYVVAAAVGVGAAGVDVVVVGGVALRTSQVSPRAAAVAAAAARRAGPTKGSASVRASSSHLLNNNKLWRSLTCAPHTTH